MTYLTAVVSTLLIACAAFYGGVFYARHGRGAFRTREILRRLDDQD